MIAHQIDNTILFYHPETGKYHIKTYIQHPELHADVMIDNKSDFELSAWYKHKDGKIFSVIGEVME